MHPVYLLAYENLYRIISSIAIPLRTVQPFLFLQVYFFSLLALFFSFTFPFLPLCLAQSPSSLLCPAVRSCSQPFLLFAQQRPLKEELSEPSFNLLPSDKILADLHWPVFTSKRPRYWDSLRSTASECKSEHRSLANSIEQCKRPWSANYLAYQPSPTMAWDPLGLAELKWAARPPAPVLSLECSLTACQCSTQDLGFDGQYFSSCELGYGFQVRTSFKSIVLSPWVCILHIPHTICTTGFFSMLILQYQWLPPYGGKRESSSTGKRDNYTNILHA